MKDTPQIQNAEDLLVLYEELAFLVSQLNSDAPKIKKMYAALEQAIAKQDATITRATQNIDAATLASVAKIQKEAKLALEASEKHLLAAEKIARRCETAVSEMNAMAKNMQSIRENQLAIDKRLEKLEAQVKAGNQGARIETTETKTISKTEKEVKSTMATTLSAYFRGNGFTVLDHRASGGALWVIGSEDDLNPYVNYVEKQFGVAGRYGSGRATDGKHAWWTKSKK